MLASICKVLCPEQQKALLLVSCASEQVWHVHGHASVPFVDKARMCLRQLDSFTRALFESAVTTRLSSAALR